MYPFAQRGVQQRRLVACLLLVVVCFAHRTDVAVDPVAIATVDRAGWSLSQGSHTNFRASSSTSSPSKRGSALAVIAIYHFTRVQFFGSRIGL
jgi:hypothetical protein